MKLYSYRKTILRRGFTLAEIAVTLGIVSFCLISVVALIPVGLNAVRTAREEAAAVKCMEQISESIRGASLSNGKYQALGIYSDMTWKLGDSALTFTKNDLSMEGISTSITADQRQAYCVRIQPPADMHSTGTALISVAWPNRASWNTSTMNWSNAQGTLSTWIIFLPHP
ncbi:MAG: type II secretion system protein [Chthoniobacteraceae bacterium]